MDLFTLVLILTLGAAPVMSINVDNVKVKVITLHNTSGIILSPKDPSGSGYQPNARYMWILEMERRDVNIEITVEKLDLGLPYTNIHDEEYKRNYTAGDFILIGGGSDVLLGDDQMFFGTRSAPKRVIVRAGVAHIFFYSTKTVVKATGFNITYQMAERPSTTPPPTTPGPTDPPLSNAVVSINGIPVNTWYKYNTTFKLAISNMASNYVHKDLNMTQIEVDPSEVLINDARTCHPDFCSSDSCVAYDFTIAIIINEEVAFDKTDLENMLADPSANDYVSDAFGSGGQICNDEPQISVLAYILIPLGIVIIGIIVTYAAWKMTGSTQYAHAQQKYEQAQRDKFDDQRRRSSGDVSILGDGSKSIASRGSLNSRRFTMPFPKTKREDDPNTIEEEEEEVDTTGFIYYDPDQAIANPSEFGLDGVVSEFTRKGHYEYTNAAFVMDEGKQVKSQQQQQQQQRSNSFHVDSDTDSDDEGALSFRPQRSEFATSKTEFQVPAEVHSADVDETIL